MKKFIFIILGLAILTAMGVLFFQSKSPYLSVERFYLELLKKTDITLSEAIKITINKTKGKIIDAKLISESDNEQPIYKIGILKDSQFLTVRIDGKTGEILSIEKPFTEPKPPIFYKAIDDS